jgi:CDP-diacylglycerol--serine O-phosphatidyltransferase
MDYKNRCFSKATFTLFLFKQKTCIKTGNKNRKINTYSFVLQESDHKIVGFIIFASMFNLANLITGSNMLCGFIAIVLALAGRIDIAPLFIFLGAVLDFFDGFVARKIGVSGAMGKQLDSLADVITFGVAPGVIMLVMIVLGIDNSSLFPAEDTTRVYQNDLTYYTYFQVSAWMQALVYNVPNNFDASIKFLPFVAMIIPFLSMFRLAKFNIDERQTDRFHGLPTPLNTMFFMFFPLYFSLNVDNWAHQGKFIHWIFDCYTIAGITVIMSLMMITDIPLIALKFKNFSWKDNKFRYLLVGKSLIIILIFQLWAIPIIVILYLILSIIDNYTTKKYEVQS